jgi:seryl-tRNA synthetase
MVDLLSALDTCFRTAALRAGAEQHSFPTLIASDTLKRTGYFDSFPGLASAVESPSRQGSYVLSPAICYHCYELLANSELDEPVVVTCCGKCFRSDCNSGDGYHLWEFTMREIVFIGSPGLVRDQREIWMQKACHWAADLGLQAVAELASDPFFGDASRGKKLLQQVKELKYELRASGPAGATMAIASFNLHEQFFTRTFNITLGKEGPAHSGCVAFGLERWALALLSRYTADEAVQRVESLQ